MRAPLQKILLVFLCVVPFFPILWRGDWAWIDRDLLVVILPSKAFWAEAVRALARIPQWNPYIFSGTPYWADANLSVLHPLNFVFLLFSSARQPEALKFFLVLHYALLGGGAYYFFRSSLGRVQSVIFATALCWSGVVMSALCLPAILAGFTAVLWCLAFWARYEKFGNLRYFVGACFGLVLAIFGGDPQFAYILFLILGVRALCQCKIGNGKAILPLLGLGACVALLGAAQILPTYSFLEQSSRSAAYLTEAKVMRFSLHPYRLVEVLLPGYFGNIDRAGDYWGKHLVNGFERPFYFSVHMGAVFLLLLGIVLYLRIGAAARGQRLSPRARSSLALAGVCGIGLLLCFGVHAPLPLYALFMKYVPLWSSFRFPERLFLWVQLGLFTLLATNLRVLTFLWHRESRGLRRIGFFVSAALAIACLLVFMLSGREPSRTAALLAGIELGAFLLVLWLLGPRRTWRHGALACVPLLALYAHASALLWSVPASLLDPRSYPHIVELQKKVTKVDPTKGEGFRFATGFLSPVDYASRRNASAGEIEKLSFAYVDSLLPNTGGFFGLYDVGGYMTLYPKDKDLIAATVQDRSRLFDLFAAPLRLVRGTDGRVKVLVSSESAPYFFLPSAVESSSSQVAALAQATRAGFPLQQKAVAEMAEAPILSPAGLVVRLQGREPDRFLFQLDQKTDGGGAFFLAVNESFDRYWTVTMNGKKIAPVRQNGWALGFLLPRRERAGQEAFTLEYANPFVPMGVAISLLTVCLLLALLGYDCFYVRDPN